MRHGLALVAVLMAAACNSTSTPQGSYVPWLPLPRGNAILNAPAPSPPVQVPTGTPVCQASQLEGILIGTFGAMGNTDTPVALRNRSSSLCYLVGIPDVYVLDAHTTVLARATGSDGVGTYFDTDVTPVPILMTTDTPALAPNDGFYGGAGLVPGWAFVNIEWAACRDMTASQVYLDLQAYGSGRVVVPFPVTAPASYPCVPDKPDSGVTRGSLDPTGVQWPPATRQMELNYKLDAPATAKRGSTLVFYVTLTNVSSQEYSLSPCPDYGEALVPGGPVTYYQLNCAGTTPLQPGASVTFQMKFAIPGDTAIGQWNLLWALVDGRITPPSVQTPITVD